MTSRLKLLVIISQLFISILIFGADGDIVINEINYHPENDCEEEEFIELYNNSSHTVDLSGWKFIEGIEYIFPPGAAILPGKYLVLAKNPDLLAEQFNISINDIIPFTSGSLSNNGEDIVLVDSDDIVMDRVDYNDRFPWPVSPDGGGPSLECINPSADNSTAANWRAAGQAGPRWRNYTTDGIAVDNTLLVNLDGAGEFLIDDISVKQKGSTTELVKNGGFEDVSLADWDLAGNHGSSYRYTENAHTGSACLKIEATSAGDLSNGIIQAIPGLELDGPEYEISFWAFRITPGLRLKAGFAGTSPILTESIDIGNVEKTGSSSEAGGVYTITASGADVWGSSDEFHYLYTEITGDVTIEAHVTWQQAPNGWSKAGLMVRESTDQSSQHAMAILSRDNGTAFQYRPDPGATSLHIPGPLLSNEARLRLTRTGNQFKAEVFTDGAFQEIGTTTIDMNDQVLAGLMVTAHEDGSIGEATFEDVLINGIGSSLSVSTPENEPQNKSIATPLSQNTQFSTDVPPFVHKIHAYAQTGNPESPYTKEISSIDNVLLMATVEDTQSITSVTAQYQVVEPGNYIRISDPEYKSNWTTIIMVDDGTSGDAEAGDAIYTAIIPSQPHRSLVRYRISATAGGKTTTVPYPDDEVPDFAYFVYDGVPDYIADQQSFHGSTPYVYKSEDLTVVPVYHLICKQEDMTECEYKAISFNDKVQRKEFTWQGTFVYDPVEDNMERKVYDNVLFRLRGGVWRYTWQKRMFKIKFRRGHHFKGEFNNGEKFSEPRRKLNLQSIIDQNWTGVRGISGLNESMAFWLFRHAGVAAPHTTYIHFRTITKPNEDGQYDGDFKGLFLDIEQPDAGLLQTNERPSGNLYKIDSGAIGQNGGRPGGWDKEETDCIFSEDDADLETFYNTYNSGTQPQTWWLDNLDLDHYFSYRVVLDSIKHYDIQAGKNYFYYHNSETSLWEVLPWDTDLILGATCCGDTTYGSNEPFWKPVIEHYPDTFGVDYRNRFREYLQLLCNRETIDPVVDQWVALIEKLNEADRDRWDYFPLPDPYPFQGKTERNPFQGLYRSLSQRLSEMRNELDKRLAFVWSNSSNFCGFDGGKIPDKPSIIQPATPEVVLTEDQLTFVGSQFNDPDNDSQSSSIWQATRIIPQGETKEWPYFAANELSPSWKYIQTVDFNTITIQQGELEPGETYLVRVRYKDDTGRMSLWSEPVKVTIECESELGFELKEEGGGNNTPLVFNIDYNEGLTFSINTILRKDQGIGDVRGWSFGVAHDNSILQINNAEITPDLQTLLDDDSEETSHAVENGFTQSVILSGTGAVVLAADTTEFKTATITYRLIASNLTPGETINTALNFSGSLGLPPVKIQIQKGEEIISPCANINMPIEIHVNEEAEFIRGDANMDGSTDLSDAIKILLFLFSTGDNLICEDAADANDDGRIDLADSILILEFLFNGGEALPAPAYQKGFDPTLDELECAQGL